MSPYRPAARRRRELEQARAQKHPGCPCGCGELADECAGPSPNPLGSMRITTPTPNPYHPKKDKK